MDKITDDLICCMQDFPMDIEDIIWVYLETLNSPFIKTNIKFAYFKSESDICRCVKRLHELDLQLRADFYSQIYLGLSGKYEKNETKVVYMCASKQFYILCKFLTNFTIINFNGMTSFVCIAGGLTKKYEKHKQSVDCHGKPKITW